MGLLRRRITHCTRASCLRRARHGCVAVAARPRDGPDPGAAGACHRRRRSSAARLRRAALLQRAAAGSPPTAAVVGENQKVRAVVRRRHLGEGRPRHGQAGRRLDDHGRTEIDHARIDYARFYRTRPGRTSSPGAAAGSAEDLQSGGASREPYTTGRNVRRSPSTSARRSAISWSWAAGSAPTATPPASTCWRSTATAFSAAERVVQPPFWRVSNASTSPSGLRHREPQPFRHLRRDRAGPRRADGWLCADRIGGDAPARNHTHSSTTRAWCAPT